jgi:PAS domain S-box-containing protein
MTHAQLVGRHVYELADACDVPRADGSCDGGLFCDDTRTGEVPIRRPDGRVVWVEYSARAGLMPGCNLIMLHDVTERRRAAENAARLAAIVGSSHDAILSLDLDGRIVDWNASAERIYGCTAAEVAGHTPAMFAPPARGGECEQILGRVLAGERVENFETVRVRKDGRAIDVSITVSPVRDPAGRIVGFSAIVRDVTRLKEAQAAIRQSEERFRTFMDNSPALAFMKDQDGRFVYVSEAYRNRAVPAGRECIGRTDADLFPAEFVERLRANDRAVLQSGKVMEVIETVPDRHGRVRHWLSHKFPFRDPAGLLYLAGQAVDITEHVEALHSLNENRERLTSALIASRTGTFRWDIATDRLDGDDELRRLFGCKPDQRLETLEDWLALVHPDDRPEIVEQARRCAVAGTDFNLCYRVVWPDGTLRWLHDRARTFRDDKGCPVYVAGACVDVTDRKRFEEALADSERFARETVDALAAHIAILDERGCIVAVNRSWQRFAESNGLACRHAGPGVDYLAVCDRAARGGSEEAAAAARAVRIVLAGDRQDGYLEYPCHSPAEQRWFAMRVTRFAGGDPVRVVIAHEDITARRQAEALERERAALRQAVGAMDHVLGVVGHELRTPLAGLRAMSEFLLTDGARQSSEFETFLRGINEEVVRMANTVNNILEAARLNSGRAKWNWSDVDVTEVCATAMDSVGPVIDAAAVRLTLRVEPPGVRMRGDADAIRRLVMNLLSNAQKHTARGSIDIIVRELRDAAAPAPAHRRLHIEVRDTGAGIPQEIRVRLGEAFALNSGVVGASYVSGSGLGLAICKGIVAAHGGEITFTSVEGRGTTVRVTLAADLSAPAEPGGVEGAAAEVDAATRAGLAGANRGVPA